MSKVVHGCSYAAKIARVFMCPVPANSQCGLAQKKELSYLVKSVAVQHGDVLGDYALDVACAYQVEEV